MVSGGVDRVNQGKGHGCYPNSQSGKSKSIPGINIRTRALAISVVSFSVCGSETLSLSCCELKL